jgi:Ni/Co efflux regulator RcnB
MNKLMLASLSLLLAGAAALPAQAQDQRRWDRAVGESGQGDVTERAQQRREAREERGEARQERGDAAREERGARRDGQAGGRRIEPVQPIVAPIVNPVAQARGNERRDWNAGRRDDRRDDRRDNRRDDRRDDRSDWRADRRDDRRDNRRDDRRDNRRYDVRIGYNDHRYDGRRYDVSRYSRHNDRRWNGNHWYPQYRYRAPVRYVYPRGYRSYQWRVGSRLPSNYYGSNYYVDYNAYRLPPPPYGYNWVRVDRDVVLVSIASGLIRDILYGLYY